MVKHRLIRASVAMLSMVAIFAGTALGASGASVKPAVKAHTATASVIFTGVTPNAYNWPEQICSNTGENICANYGVNVSFIYSASSPAALSALYAGSVQYTTALYTAAIPLYLQNPNLEYVSSGYDETAQNLTVTPDITSVNDLIGKTCASANPPNVGPYVQILIANASKGKITYPSDYKMIIAPATLAGETASLASGAVQCLASTPPTTGQLAAEGYPELVKATSVPLLDKLPLFGVNTLKSWVASHKSTNIHFLEGLDASVAWLEDPKNENAAIALLAKDSGVSLSAATASYVGLVQSGGFPREGLVKSDALRTTINFSHDTGGLAGVDLQKINGILDMSWQKKAYAMLPLKVRCEAYVRNSVIKSEKPNCKKLY